MWSVAMSPFRLASRSCTPSKGRMLPGLQLRLGSARTFIKTAAFADSHCIAAVRQQQGAYTGGKETAQGTNRILGLLAGVGVAFWTLTPSKTLYLEPGSFFSSGANKASSDGNRQYAWNNTTSDQNPFSGKDDESLPKSDVNLYNLGFGSACGICAGIFIKKGLKFVAFLLGGAFVLLQYLNTQRIINVNWRALEGRYDSAIDSAAGDDDAVRLGKPASRVSSGWRDSRAARIWNRFVHFLTADFPSRGTFIAGLVLGFRLG